MTNELEWIREHGTLDDFVRIAGKRKQLSGEGFEILHENEWKELLVLYVYKDGSCRTVFRKDDNVFEVCWGTFFAASRFMRISEWKRIAELNKDIGRIKKC